MFHTTSLYAIKHNNTDISSVFITDGCYDLAETDNEGNTYIYIAAATDQLDMIQLISFLSSNDLISTFNKKGCTPLDIAIAIVYHNQG